MPCLRAVYIIIVIVLLFSTDCLAQQATVTWMSSQAGQPLPPGSLLGGRDSDLNADLYVCRVNINGGTHPGKLLNGYCNVSFGNNGTQFQNYEVAVISGGAGHWGAWNAADTSNMLIGGHEADGSPLYVCHTDYHNGTHPGKLVPAGTCDFEWGGTEYATEIGNGQVFYLTPGPIVADDTQHDVKFPPSPAEEAQQMGGDESSGCIDGSAADCEALGTSMLHAPFTGFDTVHERVVGQCLLDRAAALKQQGMCNASSGSGCSAVAAKLQKDLSWGGCEGVQAVFVAAPYQPNNSPGCSGLSAIDARKEIWQSPTSISRGQTVTVWVPSPNGFQTWHVIDHGHNDQNSAVGNGVVAGDGFIRPGFPEGALLVRGADQVIRSFAAPDGRLSFTAPPGQIAFIANDNYKWNGHPIPPGFGFYGNGFDDNSGSITVGWSLDPCPLPPSPPTTPRPVAGCNQPGGPKCCDMPVRDYYCGLVAQPYHFAGCRAESKTGPVSCTQMICVDDGVNNTFTPPTCSPPAPIFR